MTPVTRVQLEINGKCSRGCATCLPTEFKTQAQLSCEDAERLAGDWHEAGIKHVTFAGFGSAVAHPSFDQIVQSFKSNGHFVAVVCRPDEFEKCREADSVIVSVDSIEDAGALITQLFAHPRNQRVSIHAVVGSQPFEFFIELACLARWPAISRVNLADAVALCGETGHRTRIAQVAAYRERCRIWFETVRWASPPEVHSKMTQQIEGHFPEKCAFLNDLIYVDARLLVRQCCHHPTGQFLGHLREGRKLMEVLQRDGYWDWRLGARTSLRCQHCPDVGL